MARSRPLAIDLFTGLHGWAEGLVAEGFDVVGFDLEDMCGQFGQPRPKHVHLVIQDVLTLHGSQFKGADLIVASPPCQEYSYMAMPWSKAKAKAAEYRSGKRDVKQLTALFDACFRIQREACQAAGRHIPLVVENVKGAQPWVGRARWAFGSFFLWGDVPALMPIQRYHQRLKVKEGEQWNVNRANFTGTRGWDDGKKSDGGSWFGDYAAMKEGIKQRGSGREWFADDGKISRMTSSKSAARKMASAMIAKIPLPLSRHIAATYLPQARAA